MTTPTSFLISGIPGNAGHIATTDVRVTASRRLLPRGSREAGAGKMTVAADEVTRVELNNGFVLWSRADDLIAEHGTRVVNRGGGETWEISLHPPIRMDQRGERGWLKLGIRALDFFGIDLAGKTAHGLSEKFELSRLESGSPGLYRCPMTDGFSLSPAAMNDPGLKGEQPILVFLHGTASSTQGSFGKLWNVDNSSGKEARRALGQQYGERVYAFEHRSMTHSPIRNAVDLAHFLPDGAQLHLVSHSRGGLIGELLCLAERERQNDPLRSDFKALFKSDRTIAEQLGLAPLVPGFAEKRDQSYGQDRELLEKLRNLLDEKQIKVTRFVRVACPARGTTLASGRLDRWMSVLDAISGNGLIGDGVDFLLSVVKERTDPRTLPGLEAMMPGSALTRLLHHPNLTTRSDLSVISGDVEGESLWGRIKLLAADWFYGADHDLVVNTGSMAGGMRRTEKQARFQFDQGPAVNHFNYFENKKSIEWLKSGLLRGESSHGGFRLIEDARREAPRWREAVRRSRSSGRPRPLAVVLPGTMGSALRVDGDSVWLNYWTLMWGGLKRLNSPGISIEAGTLLDDVYGPLLAFLARSHRVEIFPYNWRDSILEAAAALADRLEEWLPEAERTGQPVHIIAHSMGGLVVRAMIGGDDRGSALWRRITALPKSRFMMLGTPNHGSYEAVRWMVGHNPTQAKLALLDLKNDKDEIIDIVRQFPGLLELLPFGRNDRDFSRPDLWKALRQKLAAAWKTADASALEAAGRTWKVLAGAPPDPTYSVYVAGSQNATVADYRLADYAETHLAGKKKIVFKATAAGDGTVTWESGAIDHVPVWYVADTAHDELCRTKRAFPAYLELLMAGTTNRLPTTPPATKRTGERQARLFSMPVVPPADGIPDEESLRSVGVGPGRPFDPAAAGSGEPTIRVSVRHGDLSYASHPVLVGHYWGDTIVSAEKQLDRQMNHMLSEQLNLGIYPGPLGTHALFFNKTKDARPAGAIVLGLGQVGDISPNSLSACVCDAFLAFALKVAQWPDERFGPGDGPRSAKISSLLVGTGAGGVTVRETVSAILRGAVAANRKLVETGMEDRVLIDKIEFLEVYEDVAISAARALSVELADGELAMTVDWPSRTIEDGQGKRRRLRYDEDAAWWQRLQIICEKENDLLRFISTTNRARAEETLSTGQLRLADRFIEQASQSSGVNPGVAKSLFEMLLPNRLKEQAPKQSDIVLLLDASSARFPWELLEDRWSQTGRPPAVSAGLIRQFKTLQYRSHPAHAIAPHALVIGNPDLTGWDRFGSLPGARSEAQKVLTVLNANGFHAVGCIDEQSDAIMTGLHMDAWRILHLAGHGVHDFPLTDPPMDNGGGTTVPAAATSEKRVSGMVIGKDTILTPGDVSQMRWVPELVFINCCHLGKTDRPPHSAYGTLAANLALQFIEMGVKAVVAAGWAVDDAAAETFAEIFYQRMLAGEDFGEAVRAAREEIHKRFANVNTWGAYQCYGDPAFRLHGNGSKEPEKIKKDYMIPRELVVDLDNHTQWIRMQIRKEGDIEASVSAMQSGIEAVLQGIPESQREQWLNRADVAAALGFAWGESGAYRKAAVWLDKAIGAEAGDCPLRAVEQAANFHVRAAAEDWRTLRLEKDSDEKATHQRKLLEEVQQALEVLEGLVKTGDHIERLNLAGSACKRMAYMAAAPETRQRALERMAAYYRTAYQKDLAADDTPDPYAFTNWALARVLLEQGRKGRKTAWRNELVDECRRTIDIARRRYAEKANFWDAVAEADCKLVMLVAYPNAAAKKMETDAQAILKTYKDACRRGTSPRQLASVFDHLDFIMEIQKDSPDKIINALWMIRSGI